jgi:hypothetical protein
LASEDEDEAEIDSEGTGVDRVVDGAGVDDIDGVGALKAAGPEAELDSASDEETDPSELLMVWRRRRFAMSL